MSVYYVYCDFVCHLGGLNGGCLSALRAYRYVPGTYLVRQGKPSYGHRGTKVPERLGFFGQRELRNDIAPAIGSAFNELSDLRPT